ncbi:MAG: hypothetical protein N2999_04875 [Proteobacteria bacterium]|nr:hypothetical protein [Pseudomonadota bacterium]
MEALFNKIIKAGYIRDEIICPFFGLSDNICNTGCGYVSKGEARDIVKKCLSSFDNCARYLELTESSKGSSVANLKSKLQSLIKIF